ncbi:MAG: glycerophosphodiester phosphodiesterase family protein [Candidatus Izemoplasmatales bacterium]|nr:glycerophosphodiester phosphodiesterase family protein [Candidatus Izemoplasmatales bacterium]
MKVQKLLNKLVAHRGGKFYGLENTKEAFEGAIKFNYYGIECDIQPTKDKLLVVHHDLNILGFTGLNKDIVATEWEELKSLELTKIEVDKNTYKGKIMLFDDFLDLIKKSSCKAFIEMKETFNIEYVHMMFDKIEKSNINKEQIVIIANKVSFNLLIEIRKFNKEVKLQFVAYTDYTNYIDDCLNNQIDLDVSKNVYYENKKEFKTNIEKFHLHGLEVNCWVVDDLNLLSELESMGVDYITTDTIRP